MQNVMRRLIDYHAMCQRVLSAYPDDRLKAMAVELDKRAEAQAQPSYGALTQDLCSYLAPRNTKPLVTVEAGDEVDNLVGDWITHRESVTKWQSASEDLANKVRVAIGSAEGLITSHGRVTWKTDSRGVRTLRLNPKGGLGSV